MDIKDFMKIANDIRKSSAGNLTVGEFLDKLNQYDPSKKIKFTNEKYFDGTWDSYRGYYEDLYVGYSHKDEGFNTVGDISKTLESALNTGVMEGYKGGEFSVNLDTLVWFSSYGTSGGDMIVEVFEIENVVYIVVKEEEW